MLDEIIVNPLNEKLFSKDFIKGFRCGAHRQFKADVEEIAKAKLDAVEVVRCGECKWWDYCNKGVTMHQIHDDTISCWSEMVTFCSHGERREP